MLISNSENKLIPILQKIIEEGYRQACNYFKIIPHRKVVFKGFYNPEIYQEVLNNQEILANLKINTPRRKDRFWQELQALNFTTAGIALPSYKETWILLNPFFWKLDLSEQMLLEFAETIAHETSHAVVINIDLWRAHENPHSEITAYLKDYLWKNYNWKKILIEVN